MMTLPRLAAWPDTEAYFDPQFLAGEEAQTTCRAIIEHTPWEDHIMRIQGKEVPVPRRTAWYNDDARAYRYSGLKHEGRSWTPLLQGLRERVEAATGVRYNSVLVNLYRDGRDSVGWHADDEPELGDAPTIASLSLGSERMFRWKPQSGGLAARCPAGGMRLPSGSLLVMAGTTQRRWLHMLAKTARPVGPRVNLTFRLFGVARPRKPGL